jgi:erythromycin esterase-like protein
MDCDLDRGLECTYLASNQGCQDKWKLVTRMLGLAACVASLSMVCAVASGKFDSTPSDELQTWISGNAVTVRSIDASDDDFTDLEPLGRAIGSARVVQLGEPSHGAGSAFAAKARIAKFLHQRLGFDVLIWESGLYDVALAQAGMRSADDGVTAASRGIFTLWSAASEVRPLFEYIKASQATLRPIEMAGFDMQVTADGTRERYAQDLRAFAGALRNPVLRTQCVSLTDQAIAARERLFSSKLLVWAHNVHVMNAYYAPGFHEVHLELHPGDMKPTGVFLREWLGDKVYILGITAFQGQEGFAVGGPTNPIPPAPDGSFEARLHTLGYPYAFVDFRASQRDRQNPMRAPQTIRIPKFENNTIPDVGHVYDGIFFIDRMSPATKLSGHGGPS